MNRKLLGISMCMLLSATFLAGATTATANEWPMFHHDPQHTGYSTSKAPNTNNILWSVQIGEIVWSSPAFGKGRLYIGSDDGDLYCVDADPSEGTDEGIDDPQGATYDLILRYSTNDSILSSPAFYDGKIYFGSNDGKVYCIYACIGTEIWNYTTGDAVSSSPTVVDGMVYIGSHDGKVYRIHAEDGTHQWEFQAGDAVLSSPAVADGKVYIGSDDGNVYCLYASNGTEIWNYPTGDTVRSSPTVIDGRVYVGSHSGKVYCLDASDGTEIWIQPTGGIVSSSPAFYDGKIYIGGGNTVYCLDAYMVEAPDDEARIIWSYDTGGFVHSSPAVADEKVYVGSYDGKLYCFNASDGILLWSYDTGDIISSSPAIINMRAYAASENGTVYCFRDHNPPNIPNKPAGPTEGIPKEEYTFISDTIDPEGDQIYYKFGWGDSKYSEWLGPYESGETVNATHKWTNTGYYNITIKAKDSYGYESNWSTPLTIHIKGLDISRIRGGLGIHAEIRNVGSKKLWRLEWNISIVGGVMRNRAIEMTEGSILSLGAGEIETVRTGVFFELGRLKITVAVSDNSGENTVSKTVNAFAFGFLVILIP